MSGPVMHLPPLPVGDAGTGAAAAKPAPVVSQRPAQPAVRVPAQARVRLFVPSHAWGGRRRREILFAAAAIAVLFHVLLTVAILEAPHLWPAPPIPLSVPPPSASDPPTIEMLMDKNRYAGGSQATPPASPAPPAPVAPPSPPKPQPPAAPDLASSTLTSPEQVTVPPAAHDPTTTQPPSPTPPAPEAAARPNQPQVNLDQADGLGYGMQDDPRIIPASPDDRHANRMPPYPSAAGRRGEEGSVQMLIRIAADGSVTSVEVATSSGYQTLDRTAHDAVARWHFRPAIQNGVAVPTQMMQVFNFRIDRNHP
ncbi:MAG: energy transducer TonB [Janthinobacterium lividum]